MEVVNRLNGKIVTEQELEDHFRKKRELFGADYYDFANWGGRVPQIKTNSTFMRGLPKELDMDDQTYKHYEANARKAGISPQGKHYFSQVASGRAAADGWCADADEVIARARAGKMKIEINGQTYDFRESMREIPDDKPYEVRQNIVDMEVDQEIKRRGGKVTKRQRENIEADIRDDITPKSFRG